MMRLYWPSEKAPSILDGTWKPPEGEGGFVTAYAFVYARAL